jgi:Protein of unknown function (DUF2924)
MPPSLASEIAALGRLTVPELRAKFAAVFGESTQAHNKVWLVKRLAWRLQALAEGDLSQRARQRAAELVNDADLRLSPPRADQATADPAQQQGTTLRLQADDRLPRPGTILTRRYKGRTLQVEVLEHGFACDGQVYRSLSAVAKAVTGSHCSGHLFFRLNSQGADQ